LKGKLIAVNFHSESNPVDFIEYNSFKELDDE